MATKDRETQLDDPRQSALLPADEIQVIGWDRMIEAWINTLDREETRKSYKRTVCALAADLGGDGPLLVTAEMLGGWRRREMDKMEAGELSPGTVRRKIYSVRSFFRFAHLVRQSLISPDLRKAVLTAPNGAVQKPFMTLSDDDGEQLLGVLDGDQRKAIAVMFYAGLRVSELCRLRAGDYYRNGDAKLWLNVQGKGGKVRKVPVSTTLAKIMGDPESGDGPLFSSRQRNKNGSLHYTRVRFWQILRAGLAEAWPENEKGISPHSLRHSAAMRWLRAGVHLTMIQKWLGHAKLDTTRLYLDHLSEEEAHDAYAIGDGIMSAPKGNQYAATVGHRSSTDALRRGDDFRGLASEKLDDVTDAFNTGGADPLLEELALRVTATALLWSDALRTAIDERNHERLDRYSKTFGQLSERAFKMLSQIREQQGDAIDGAVITDALERP